MQPAENRLDRDFTADEPNRKWVTDITCSMSRTGCCYDNAAMERFFWSLKHEWTKHDTFPKLNGAGDVRQVRSCMLDRPLEFSVSPGDLIIELPRLEEGDVLLLQ